MLCLFPVYVETGILIRSVVCCGQRLRHTIDSTVLTSEAAFTAPGVCAVPVIHTSHDVCPGLTLQSCHFANCINPYLITSNFCRVLSAHRQTSCWWWQSCQLYSTGNTDDDILLARNQSWPRGNLKCRTNIMLLLVEISPSHIKWQVGTSRCKKHSFK